MSKRSDTIWGEDNFTLQRMLIGFVPSKAAWRKTVDRISECDRPYPSAAACMSSFEGKPGKRVCLVTVADEVDTRCTGTEIIGLLAHEAMHVTQELMDLIGERSPSIEFEAHTLQAITQELVWAYEKTRRRLFLPFRKPK